MTKEEFYSKDWKVGDIVDSETHSNLDFDIWKECVFCKQPYDYASEGNNGQCISNYQDLSGRKQKVYEEASKFGFKILRMCSHYKPNQITSSHNCNCHIVTLLQKGCQCGGI